MLVSDLFNIPLMENLGNLQQLKVGKMINILKEPFVSRGKSGTMTGPTQNTFIKTHEITAGPTSEIFDGGKLTSFAQIRKLVKAKDGQAVAIYLDGKAVAFISIDDYSISGSSRAVKIAYDFSKLEAEILDKRKGDWKFPLNVMPTERTEKKTDWRTDKEVITHRAGIASTTGDVAKMIDALIDIAGSDRLTFKVVARDSVSYKTRRDRSNARSRAPVEKFTGAEALAARLRVYKLSKQPTIDDVRDLIKHIMSDSKIKQFRFKGVAYNLTGENSSDLASPRAILSGKPIVLRFKSSEADPNHYRTYSGITIHIALDSNTMTLKPYKAEYTDITDGEKGERVTEILDHPHFMKTEMGISDHSDKKQVLTKVLTLVKDKKFDLAKSIIEKSRAAGVDFPEFTTILKSISD